MLILSSLHVHEVGVTSTVSACNECVHHQCHGHLTQTASWAHDCVLCQFLTLTMLTAVLVAVVLYVDVCKKYHAQPLCGCRAACCGIIGTRGPPAGEN